MKIRREKQNQKQQRDVLTSAAHIQKQQRGFVPSVRFIQLESATWGAYIEMSQLDRKRCLVERVIPTMVWNGEMFALHFLPWNRCLQGSYQRLTPPLLFSSLPHALVVGMHRSESPENPNLLLWLHQETSRYQLSVRGLKTATSPLQLVSFELCVALVSALKSSTGVLSFK